MIGRQPSLILFNAISLAPAINLDTEAGALPATRMFTTCRSREQIVVGRGILATSIKCYTRKPEGLAAVPLGKDSRTEWMLKSGSSVTGAQSTACTKRAGPLGCFAFSSYQVVSLFGAIAFYVLMKEVHTLGA